MMSSKRERLRVCRDRTGPDIYKKYNIPKMRVAVFLNSRQQIARRTEELDTDLGQQQ